MIPNSVTILDDGAFRECKSLKKVVFQDDSRLQKIGKCCFQGSGLEKFQAAQSLRVIECSAFCGCKYLKQVELNEGLKVLGNDNYYAAGTFEDSGVKEITITATLERVCKNLFANCSSLRTVWVEEGCPLDI